MKKKFEKKEDERENEGMNKAIKWFVILGIVFFIVYLATPLISDFYINTFKTVEYGNLTFTKTRFGEIPVYYYWYNFEDKEGNINRYNVYLRLDPSKNDIPVTGEIEYPSSGKLLYIAIDDEGFEECKNKNRELATLAMFLGGNKFNLKNGFYGNESFVNETLEGAEYIDCSMKPENMVIQISRTNRSIIDKENEFCYNLEFDTCENLLKVVEKFEVQSLIDAKNRSLYE
jgi:hypothetical protein